MSSNLIFISMKKFLILVVCVFFTYTTFAQSERDQKIQKRVERDTRPPRVTTPSNPPVVVTPTPRYYNPYYSPYYNPYDPFRHNNWGYRSRYNRRRYSSGVYLNPSPVVTTPVRKSSQSDDVFFAVGIIGTFPTELPSTFGFRVSTGGDKIYIFGNFEYSPGNPFSYYHNITLQDVTDWSDEYRETYSTNTKWDLGIGLKINDIIHPTLAFGSNRITDYLVYFDETKVLSSNGLYSIDGGMFNRGSMTMGIDVHLEDVMIIHTGLGLLGPPRLSLGLQFKIN